MGGIGDFFIYGTKSRACHGILHVVTTWRNADYAMRKKYAAQYVWSAALATQNDNEGFQNDAPTIQW